MTGWVWCVTTAQMYKSSKAESSFFYKITELPAKHSFWHMAGGGVGAEHENANKRWIRLFWSKMVCCYLKVHFRKIFRQFKVQTLRAVICLSKGLSPTSVREFLGTGQSLSMPRELEFPVHLWVRSRWRGGVGDIPQQLHLARSVSFCPYCICFQNVCVAYGLFSHLIWQLIVAFHP